MDRFPKGIYTELFVSQIQLAIDDCFAANTENRASGINYIFSDDVTWSHSFINIACYLDLSVTGIRAYIKDHLGERMNATSTHIHRGEGVQRKKNQKRKEEGKPPVYRRSDNIRNNKPTQKSLLNSAQEN